MFDQVASWEGAAARFISGITLYASQNLPKPVSSSGSLILFSSCDLFSVDVIFGSARGDPAIPGE